MAHIDQFIEMMHARGFDRASLVGDHNGQLWHGAQESAGPAIPLQQLQAIVQEATPPPLRPQLSADGRVQFVHQSPHGPYQIAIERHGGALRVQLQQGNGAASETHQANEGAPVSTQPADYGHANDSLSYVEAEEVSDDIAAIVKKRGQGTRHIEHIDDLFRYLKSIEASDLHLASGVPPMIRDQGIMRVLDEYEANDPERLKELLFKITPPRNQEQWNNERDTDFSYDLPGVARFRCNLYADRHGIGGSFRLIPSEVLTVKQLHLPPVMTELCNLSKGLVVVTGPTGSGKSTTLAALIDHLNKTREDHIVTIEDPVEFVHENIRCLINQREVHVHTQSFKRALRAALREDPDIVLVGEMRDLETIAIAIETAETGHLVFGTLHTSTAASTVDRIIDQFPPAEQAQIRVMLSESLKGVIAQTLLRTVDGKRVAAFEILLVPTAVANLIREGKTFQLPSQIEIGKAHGMVSMNDSILQFVKAGRVAPMEGYIKAVDKIGLLQAYEANGIESPVDMDAHHH